MAERIRNERELNSWFTDNYKKLVYDKIIRKDIGTFPDFIMEKGGNKISVELETLSSHFVLHGHNPKGVDEIVCIKKDIEVNVPVITINELEFILNIKRISATIDEETDKVLDQLMKTGEYRNKSHVIEECILKLWRIENEKK